MLRARRVSEVGITHSVATTTNGRPLVPTGALHVAAMY